MRETDLTNWLDLADRRRRFRWQAEVNGPGSSGVSMVHPTDRAPDLADRLAPLFSARPISRRTPGSGRDAEAPLDGAP